MNSLINPEATPVTAPNISTVPAMTGGNAVVGPADTVITDTSKPAAALDKVAAEPGVLQKALGLAQPYLAKVDAVTHPYVEKVQQTTKPYTDAAINKAKELVDKMENPQPYAGTPTATASQGGLGATSISGEKTLGSTANPSFAGSAHTSTTGSSQTLEDRLDGIIASVSRRASVVANKIDEKTATPDKPGWASQLMSGVQKVTDKADAYIQGHAPTATNHTSTTGHPIQTTTNSLTHTDKPAEPTLAATSTSAGPPVPIAAVVVPVVPAVPASSTAL